MFCGQLAGTRIQLTETAPEAALFHALTPFREINAELLGDYADSCGLTDTRRSGNKQDALLLACGSPASSNSPCTCATDLAWSATQLRQTFRQILAPHAQLHTATRRPWRRAVFRVLVQTGRVSNPNRNA